MMTTADTPNLYASALQRANSPEVKRPYSGTNLSHLDLNSTLADLPTHHFEVSVDDLGHKVASRLNQEPELPGVIIVDAGKVVTAVSRRRFLANIGRTFGLEIYLNRPIKILINSVGSDHLSLPQTLSIREAAEMALTRPAHLFYEPVIITDGQKYRLLDIQTLLFAQTALLKQVNQLEQDRRQMAESLQKIGTALLSSLSLKKVTKQILKELDKVVTYERAVVLLRDADELESIVWRGFPKGDSVPRKMSLALQDNDFDVFKRIIATQEPMILGDVTQEPGWQQLDWLPLNHSWLGVPLISQSKVIGMISLTRPDKDAFTQDDVFVVTAFAIQAAIALENAQLYEQIVNFNDHLEAMVAERTDELNQAYKILEKLDKTKSDFIQVSAHELRTPLTVVRGYAQVMGTMPVMKEDANLRAIVDGIVSGVDRLHHIVNSMLDVAKIDSKTLDVIWEEVQLHDILQLLVLSFHDDVVHRGISLTLDNIADLPTVQGDSDLIKKVFYAVLVNGIKFTPDGGSVMVSGEIVQQNGRSWVQISVTDTGIGIDPDQQELIFEKFYQTGELALHSSGQTKFMAGGPGLGLAITKGILEALNGRIAVKSAGRDEENYPGSCFTILLPAVE